MAVQSLQDLEYAEKAQASAAVAPGGVMPHLPEEEEEDVLDVRVERLGKGRPEQDAHDPSVAGSEQSNHAGTELEEEEEEGVADDEATSDLEAMRTVTTNGPPFSVFTPKQKRFIVFMAAFGGFFSAVSANIYFPALNTLAADFHVSSGLINLTLTSYMIFQGLAPTLIGDLADMAGRRPAFIICFVIYIGANIGLALCQDYASLFVLRCLQSSGSSGTISLASGVVADIATSAERGSWMGWVTAGPMIAPAIGPVIGGILAQFLGWRSIFWFLVILATVYLIPQVLFFPETGRNVVGNGSIPPQKWNMSLLSYLAAKRAAKKMPQLKRSVSRESQRQEQARLASSRKLRFPNPWHTLSVVLEKDVGMLLFYNAIVYTAFYDVTSSTPSLFAEIYGFNDLQIGLCYIPFGAGCFLAPVMSGRLLDWNFRRLAHSAGIRIEAKRSTDLRDFPLEKARCQIAGPLTAIGNACLLCYGWVVQVNAPLAAPLVLQFIIGVTLTGAFNCMNVMLVDLYPMSPATATAANNLVRCLLGAGGTAAIIPMINAMGRGWCFTFIAFVVALCSPILWVLQKWGPQWREARRARIEVAKERKMQVQAEKEAQRDAVEMSSSGEDNLPRHEEKT